MNEAKGAREYINCSFAF